VGLVSQTPPDASSGTGQPPQQLGGFATVDEHVQLNLARARLRHPGTKPPPVIGAAVIASGNRVKASASRTARSLSCGPSSGEHCQLAAPA